MRVQPISGEDVLEWPDGTWCTRDELPDMSHMSDDYIVHPYSSPSWFNFMHLNHPTKQPQGEAQ